MAGAAGAAGGSSGLAAAGRTAGPRGLRQGSGDAAAGPALQAPGPSGPLPALLVGAALAVLLVGWPAGRALLRGRGLRRGSYDERLRASVALVFTDLKDYGVRLPASQTLDETARYLDARLGLDAGSLMTRVQAVFFGGRAATPQDLADVAVFRRELRRRMRARRGRVRAVLVLYGVPAAAAAEA